MGGKEKAGEGPLEERKWRRVEKKGKASESEGKDLGDKQQDLEREGGFREKAPF